MADITINNEHIPAPDRDRNGHVPSPGDIYYYKDTYYPLIVKIKEIVNEDWCIVTVFDFDGGKWVVEKRKSLSDLKEYYRLVLADFPEIWKAASKVNAGDDSLIRDLHQQANTDEASMALVASRPAQQVFALTEASERLQDKLETINDVMKLQIAHMRSQMEARLSVFNKELDRIKDYVRNLHRIITVMNLYTGTNVDVNVICEGAPAMASLPIAVRQRILFMDEEYLADAENQGIDCEDIDKFCEWLRKPANRDIICPEPKCIVAMKPKRYDKSYTNDYHTNQLMNRWNHHTIVIFRDGQRLLMVDSEDLELFDVALPWSDQQERFEKEYQKIMAECSFQESNLKRLKEKSENLGYMYTKYISFLQGMIDSGKIFDLSAGRPNFAKEEGVTYIHDAENAIGTGESWYGFQKRINEGIRRGTRVIFFPFGHDERGYEVECGESNRKYWNKFSNPASPKKGLYNVDYPTKIDHVKNLNTGRFEKITSKLDRLAIFYIPERFYTESDRTEAFIYNPWCVLNYDKLTVEDIDRFMADRTQRESFRGWMPILQEARKRLIEEKQDEDYFIQSMGNTLVKEHPEIYTECLHGLIDEAIGWWKNKVIFTRPLRSDDAKAWRMIKKRCVSLWRQFLRSRI